MPSLKAYNTFGVDAQAPEIIHIQNVQELAELEFSSVADYFILGGGSNLLLTRNLTVPVLKNEILGKMILLEDDEKVLIELGGGENWHETVLWTVKNNFGGFENLSLIPGTVGAAPIQNIGAYGVEIKDFIYEVKAYDLIKRRPVSFFKEDCQFAYRDSIFKKQENKGRYFICSVVVQLHTNEYEVKTSYGIIKDVLLQKEIDNPSIADISNAVIEIRQSKLPDPKDIGNSGSFFKNPIVKWSVLDEIKKDFESVPHYKVDEEYVKIPAGWLIEQMGWKGKRVGNTGNYEKQALIIVNHGDASGTEIYEHACNVQQSVKDRFSIALDFEVNVL